MFGPKYGYLLAALPPQCTVGYYGYCPVHLCSWHGRGAWCPAAVPTALNVARVYERLAARPADGWWGQTAYRRRLWRKLCNEKAAAAQHIRRMAMP